MDRHRQRAHVTPRERQILDASAAEDGRSEERTWVAAAQVDRQAFAPLYERYLTAVYRYLVQRASDGDVAEELTAATFGRALDSLDRYAGKGSFAAWLFGIARHTAQDYYRRKRPSIAMEFAAANLVDPTPSPESQFMDDEQARGLRRLIGELPASQQEVLALYFFAELRIREVADVLGRSEGSVRMLMHRAILDLRGRYRREE